ncbi:MAG: tyrosine--tRNA ligase [Parcubacteria group bacterium]|nr:MAG: tyrosine--tRNA ligase [Parcubacteria group bacterium]
MPKINTDREKIQELLTRSVSNVYPNREYLEKLLRSGQRLSLYLGIDPTGDSLHLGHAINLEKLRAFQELGHQVILLIGDFTAMVGDPTDKKATRQPLTRAQVLSNAKDYKKQAAKFLDFTGPNKALWKYNSDWHDKLQFPKIMEVASHFTVQQLLERDMFQERIKNSRPISLHEFLYPLLQAYDCIAMKVDGELGGNDQTFNMLSGRDLSKTMLHKDKFVLTMKLLEDQTGKKMGKTEGNMLALKDSAKDMYGKVMSWTDGMILPGFELCTRIPMKEIKLLVDIPNPRNAKARLAYEITKIFHGKDAAMKAGREFEKVFSKKENPEDIKVFGVKPGSINPIDLLMAMKFINSKSEAKRLVEGGGLKLNHNKVVDWQKNITIKSGDVIQAGKRKFGKIK